MEIVRNHKLSIPSRSKYKLDKIGIGEALFVPASELKDPRSMQRIQGAAYNHARARNKTFRSWFDAEKKALVILREADPKKA